MDPYEIGWYIESADEDIYGPISRKSLRRFLEEKTISPNTLVRHCTEPEAKPVVEHSAIMQGLSLQPAGPSIGDKLDEAWPAKKRDQLALAEDLLPCWKHRRPAVLVCVRCHAPYCNKCRAKPFKKQFFLCRRCHVGMWNRRFGALILDNMIFIYGSVILAMPLAFLLSSPESPLFTLFLYGGQFLGIALLFVRDAIFGGGSPGKRAAGLRVVQSKDGKTRLTIGQGIVRWLSQLIPIFNLVDAAAAYNDPLQRRYGDRWAGTRVVDSARKLAKDRLYVARRLIKKKGIQPPAELPLTMQGFARLD
jgi:uncharacterized RDD family membrane protein YckC